MYVSNNHDMILRFIGFLFQKKAQPETSEESSTPTTKKETAPSKSKKKHAPVPPPPEHRQPLPSEDSDAAASIMATDDIKVEVPQLASDPSTVVPSKKRPAKRKRLSTSETSGRSEGKQMRHSDHMMSEEELAAEALQIYEQEMATQSILGVDFDESQFGLIDDDIADLDGSAFDQIDERFPEVNDVSMNDKQQLQRKTSVPNNQNTVHHLGEIGAFGGTQSFDELAPKKVNQKQTKVAQHNNHKVATGVGHLKRTSSQPNQASQVDTNTLKRQLSASTARQLSVQSTPSPVEERVTGLVDIMNQGNESQQQTVHPQNILPPMQQTSDLLVPVPNDFGVSLPPTKVKAKARQPKKQKGPGLPGMPIQNVDGLTPAHPQNESTQMKQPYLMKLNNAATNQTGNIASQRNSIQQQQNVLQPSASPSATGQQPIIIQSNLQAPQLQQIPLDQRAAIGQVVQRQLQMQQQKMKLQKQQGNSKQQPVQQQQPVKQQQPLQHQQPYLQQQQQGQQQLGTQVYHRQMQQQAVDNGSQNNLVSRQQQQVRVANNTTQQPVQQVKIQEGQAHLLQKQQHKPKGAGQAVVKQIRQMPQGMSPQNRILVQTKQQQQVQGSALLHQNNPQQLILQQQPEQRQSDQQSLLAQTPDRQPPQQQIHLTLQQLKQQQQQLRQVDQPQKQHQILLPTQIGASAQIIPQSQLQKAQIANATKAVRLQMAKQLTPPGATPTTPHTVRFPSQQIINQKQHEQKIVNRTPLTSKPSSPGLSQTSSQQPVQTTSLQALSQLLAAAQNHSPQVIAKLKTAATSSSSLSNLIKTSVVQSQSVTSSTTGVEVPVSLRNASSASQIAQLLRRQNSAGSTTLVSQQSLPLSSISPTTLGRPPQNKLVNSSPVSGTPRFQISQKQVAKSPSTPLQQPTSNTKTYTMTYRTASPKNTTASSNAASSIISQSFPSMQPGQQNIQAAPGPQSIQNMQIKHQQGQTPQQRQQQPRQQQPRQQQQQLQSVQQQGAAVQTFTLNQLMAAAKSLSPQGQPAAAAGTDKVSVFGKPGPQEQITPATTLQQATSIQALLQAVQQQQQQNPRLMGQTTMIRSMQGGAASPSTIRLQGGQQLRPRLPTQTVQGATSLPGRQVASQRLPMSRGKPAAAAAMAAHTSAIVKEITNQAGVNLATTVSPNQANTPSSIVAPLKISLPRPGFATPPGVRATGQSPNQTILQGARTISGAQLLSGLPPGARIVFSNQQIAPGSNQQALAASKINPLGQAISDQSSKPS